MISLATVIVAVTAVTPWYSNKEIDLPQATMEIDLPKATVESILEPDYLAAYEENTLNPVRDDYYSQVTYPETGAAFYKIAIKDQGYSEDLPIDVNVFFSLDGDGLVLENSYFAIAEMPSSPKYANVFFFINSIGAEKDDILLSIDVNTVGLFNAKGKPYRSIPYQYTADARFHIPTLETLSYKVR